MAAQQVDSDKQSVVEESSQNLSPKEGSTEGGGHDAESPTLVYAEGLRLTAIVTSLMLSMFLVALDNVSRHELGHDKKLIQSALRPSSVQPSPKSPMSFRI